MATQDRLTLGEDLVRRLGAWGIDTVFGIPGVHTIELYRGIAGSGLRHVTPRHEQGAGFMADGYARVTGRPAAAFVITGPGLTNITTAMAQAYADSVPMLVISSVNRLGRLGGGAGDLHEVRRQGLIGEFCAAFSHTVLTPDEVPAVLARAFAVFESARPRPVHIEIPVDLLAAPATGAPIRRNAPVPRPVAPADAVAEAAKLLGTARRPLILAGGGARGAALAELAERVDAPVVMTTNARGLVAMGHPLAVPCSPSLRAVQVEISGADAVLAVGTEWGRTDYDMYDRGMVRPSGTLARIEIDPAQMHRGAAADLPLPGDAAGTVAALLEALPDTRSTGGAERAKAMRDAAWEEIGDTYRRIHPALEAMRDAVPGAAIVGDSTNPVYAGNMFFATGDPRAPGGQWFNAATGYGALGYGLPAAIGAALGTGRPVVALAGDGGLQFTLTDIGAAVETGITLVIVVWNNSGYGEIKDYMVEAGVETVGVDLVTPDFCDIARAYGAIAHRLELAGDLGPLIRSAATRGGVTLIDVPEALFLGD